MYMCGSYINTVIDRTGTRNIMSEGLAHRHALHTHSAADGSSWLLYALQHNERANPEGIAFVRSLRGVHPIWRDTCDDILGNRHWMAPSVTAGFLFAENELPTLLRDALRAILNHNPMQNFVVGHVEVFPVFQQNVAGIVQAMHTYSSDMPTQARIMYGLVKLFRTQAIVLHVRRIMEDLPYSMPLVCAVLRNMQLYRREYGVVMLCIELLRLLCRNRFLWQEIGIHCGTVKVLLEIMNTNDQPASYAQLRIACYNVLMGLCVGKNPLLEHVAEHGGVPILRQVLTRDMHWTANAADDTCAQFMQ